MKQSRDSLTVRVKPRSSQPGVEIGASGEVVVRVHAAAVEGVANREMMEVLARALGVPKSAIRILHGEKSRTKRVAVDGLSAAEVGGRVCRASVPFDSAQGRPTPARGYRP